MSDNAEDYYKEIEETRIAVIGLGFVGLPQALLFLKKGFIVTGIEIDEKKVNDLYSGKSYIPDVSDDEIQQALSTKRFNITSDYEHIRDQDVIIICVPTPLAQNGLPDLSFLQSVSEKISSKLRKYQLIILESSSYPGTTKEIFLPLADKNGLQVGEDLFIAYSPERIDPGNHLFTIEEIPKVISGVTLKCQKYILNLYSKVYENVVPVSSTEVAELSKLLENSYRFLNISFMNEIAMFCDALDLDVWEVLEAASTKPYGFHPFTPGPGIGGHCIPVDPMYLIWKANQYGIEMKFLELANQINQQIPHYVTKQLLNLLDKTKSLHETTILIYGVTYKKNIGDLRESPALKIMSHFINLGAKVLFHDPFIKEIQLEGTILSSQKLDQPLLKEVDCVLILTDHKDIPIELIVENSRLVFDTRNVTSSYSEYKNVYRLGAGKSNTMEE